MVRYFLFSLALIWSAGLQAQITFFNTYSNAGFDKGEGICQLPDSSYMLIGTSTSFFDGPSQFFIARLDSNGTLLWSRDAGGSEVDNGKRIFVLGDQFYSFGFSSSNPSGDFDFQMVKGGIDGSLQSIQQIAHPGWDFLNDILFLPDSTFVLAGYTNSSADGKPDAFYMKIDTTGNILQNIQNNALEADEITSVKLLNDSTFVIGGYRYNADSSLFKAYIKAVRLNGSLVWQQEYGDIGSSRFDDLLVTQHGLYGTGSIQRVSDNLWQDYYIRLDYDGNIIEQNIGNSSGEKWAKQLVHLGGFNYFLAVETDDNFSFGDGTDVSYYSFNETLDFQGSAVSVQVDLTDRHGQAIPTSDGGFIAIGSTEKFGDGESSVYVIKAFKNNYPVTTAPTGYGLVGIHEADFIENSVFPNPVDKDLYIQFSKSVDGLARIYDYTGKLMYEQPLMGQINNLDLSNLSSGLFLLKIETEEGSAIHRIVKR